MYQRLLGIVGVLLGGSILFFGLFGRGSAGRNGAYAAGQSAGWMFGLVLFLAGILYLLKSRRSSAQ